MTIPFDSGPTAAHHVSPFSVGAEIFDLRSPESASANLSTPTLTLFCEWEARRLDLLQARRGDDALLLACDRLRDLEDRLLAEPAAGLRDLAAKVLVDTDRGAHGLSERLLMECEEILRAALAQP